jgi:hypothetical protein
VKSLHLDAEEARHVVRRMKADVEPDKLPNASLSELQGYYDSLCAAWEVVRNRNYPGALQDAENVLELLRPRNRNEAGERRQRVSRSGINAPRRRHPDPGKVDVLNCCFSSDTCCSDRRNTIFQASPRQSIKSIANVIAANSGDRLAFSVAVGRSNTVSNPARVSDTSRGIHASTVFHCVNVKGAFEIAV